MIGYLLQIDAWNGPTATPLCLASHDDERLCHLNGQVWWPAIASLPTLRYDFFDGSFDPRSITSPTGSLTISVGAIPNLPALAIHDARVRIWKGQIGAAFGTFALIFDGRVKDQPAVADGIATVSIGTDDSWLDKPLLSTYAGTGAAEGAVDLQGQVKPLALGAPRFVPAVLVDSVDNIYQVSGYGALSAMTMAFDRLIRVGAPVADYASFAALKAATVARGTWATCLAGGYARFGAPPVGLVCFHVQGDAVGGWSRLPGALIARIATIAGGSGKYSTGDIANINSVRAWPLSVVVTAQTTARELIQRIAASVNAVAYIDWLGVLRVAAVGIGTATATMAADGSALPPVSSVEQTAASAPYWKLAQGAATTWQVHGLGDIAFTAPLNPRGPFDPAETYREGDMVTLADGSQWLFVAAVPALGSVPSDANPDWFRIADNITAGNITYEDGTPVEALKPAEAGATNGASPSEKVQIAQHEIDIAAAKADIDAAVADIVAQGTAISTIEAAVAANDGDIAALNTALGTANANIASNSTAITGLNSAVALVETELDAHGNSIADLSFQLGVLATDDENAAGALLAAAITNSQQSASFSSERTLRTNSEEAIARSVDAIGVRMGAAEAGISTEATVRATADTALSNQLNTLTSTVNGNTAAISSEASTRATADTALSNSITALSATVDGNTAAISAETSARVSADNAFTSSINSITATVNGHTTSISTNASAIASANGNITTLFARYALRLDVNGYTIGYEINNSGSTGSIVFRADLFAIGAPGAGTAYPFQVIGGNTYIQSAFIQDLTIGTTKIDPSAISEVTSASYNDNIDVREGAGEYYPIVEVAVPSFSGTPKYVQIFVDYMIGRRANGASSIFAAFYKVEAANVSAFRTFQAANNNRVNGNAYAVWRDRQKYETNSNSAVAARVGAGEIFIDTTPTPGDLYILAAYVIDSASGSTSPMYRQVEVVTEIRWR